MKLSNLFTDDDAVSPVIGVILMVAITVILAAVIGAFVLNIGGSQDTAPQATFEFNYNGTDVVVSHQGGDAIDKSTIKLSGNVTTSSLAGTGEWTAGESVTASNTIANGPGAEIEVVWESPNSDKSSIIGTGSAE